MKLKELVKVFDGYQMQLKIQVCKEDNWDEYDAIFSDSPILKTLEDKEVITAGAIEEDVIRVDLRWDEEE